MQRGVFCFFHGRGKKGREGRVIARRQKGQAYSGFDVAHERGQGYLLRDHIWPKEKGVGLFGGGKSQERQILRKTWCRDDWLADR
jgi:hypothetical protein